MGKKTAKSSNLGRSLIKDRFGHGKRTVGEGSMLHTTEVQDGYDWGRLNLQSVTEESSFQEFLRTAELAGTEFQAEKLNIAFVNPKSNVGVLSYSEQTAVAKRHAENKVFLKIPRRPKWTEQTTTEELTQMENFNFLEWRRQLALLQQDESLIMTPYEKNIQFWRQLWRVIERSDVVVQIVDARNPLLFRNEDLESYVKEVNENKMNMILINKADFLTEEQRIQWADYFQARGILVVFYSALLAQEKIKESLRDIKEEDESKDFGDSESDDDSESENSIDEAENAKFGKKDDIVHETDSINKDLVEHENTPQENINQDSTQKIIPQINECIINNPNILERLELIDFFKNIYNGPRRTKDVVTIGLVGYPNVGKSSTINTLMIDKKVSVSATPGKTKHFQTLFVDNELLLCDSPGMVMPSFVSTKAEMILNGILPIDQMRDFVPPVNILCTQIPRHILEDKYGIMIARPQEGEELDRPPFAEELLLAHGYNRGFMTANGQPDQPRSARYVLKDYVAGKLLYCHAPPSIKQEEFHIFPDRIRPVIPENELPKEQQRAMRINRTETTSELDSKFFHKKHLAAHIQGKSNFPHIRMGVSASSTSSSTTDNGEMIAITKPWRKQKKEKREKLRRKFAHLDQH